MKHLGTSESARVDAEVLLTHVLACSRSLIYTWPERALTNQQWSDYQSLLERRAEGEPVAYLIGQREFWSLPIQVTRATLIPRPETELLVELALARIPKDAQWHIADLGTGSGAIALAIASERPLSQLIAVDRSEAALAIARDNALRLGLTNVRLLQGHWLEPLKDACFEMIVSNPPYIATNDPHLSQGDLRFEPRDALASGIDGLDDIRHITDHAWTHLHPGGWLLFEHGNDQGQAVSALLTRRGFEQVHTECDLAGHDRITLGSKPLA